MTSPAPEPRRRSSKAPFWIGCGIVLLIVLLCGGVLIYFSGRGIQAFRQGFDQARQDEAFAQQWRAPAADAPPATFAPESVAGYELATTDENAAFPALGIEHAGTHSVYEQGDDTIDVAVYRMNETERSATYDEVIRRIDDDERFAFNSHWRTTRSLRFRVDPPALHGVFWHADGWLVFVRSQTIDDLEPFLRAYLEAVDAAESDAPEEPSPAPDEPPAASESPVMNESSAGEE